MRLNNRISILFRTIGFSVLGIKSRLAHNIHSAKMATMTAAFGNLMPLMALIYELK